VDKFLLIDYWRSEGRYIIQKRGKTKVTAKTCANDVSFLNFVDYVVREGGNGGKSLNTHWKPIHNLCSPCLLQPHVIGKMETFSRDSKYILERMNMTWILDAYDHETHVHQEMDMLIVYNWNLFLKKSYARHYANCTNSTDLARRLWTAFQINGYLPIATPFPVESYPFDINMTEFQKLAHESYNKRPTKSVSEWKRQREKAMLDAFREIPTDTLYKLRQLYDADFEMFGYDPEPSHIFTPDRKQEFKKQKDEEEAERVRQEEQRKAKEEEDQKIQDTRLRDKIQDRFIAK
jgi:hypothetical protein